MEESFIDKRSKVIGGTCVWIALILSYFSAMNTLQDFFYDIDNPVFGFILTVPIGIAYHFGIIYGMMRIKVLK